MEDKETEIQKLKEEGIYLSKTKMQHKKRQSKKATSKRSSQKKVAKFDWDY